MERRVDAVVQEALEMKVDNQVDDILEETRKEIKKQIGQTVLTAVTAEMGRCHDQAKIAYDQKIAELFEEEVQRRLDETNSMYTRVISKAPNLNVNNSVNPGLHLQW